MHGGNLLPTDNTGLKYRLPREGWLTGVYLTNAFGVVDLNLFLMLRELLNCKLLPQMLAEK